MTKTIFLLLGLILFSLGAGFLILTKKPAFISDLPLIFEEELEPSLIAGEPQLAGSSASPANQKFFFLEVVSPGNNQKVNTPQVEIVGKTLPTAEVFMNDLEVKPDEQGNFSTKIFLAEGENPILVVAGNEIGDGEVARTVFYEVDN